MKNPLKYGVCVPEGSCNFSKQCRPRLEYASLTMFLLAARITFVVWILHVPFAKSLDPDQDRLDSDPIRSKLWNAALCCISSGSPLFVKVPV